MKTLILLSAFSALGLLVIFFRRLYEVRIMSQEEFLYSLKDTRPFFSSFYKILVVPVKLFYKNIFLPWFFKRAEKTVHGFRILVLKAEHNLFDLKHYFRGKHDVNSDGHSPYWKEMKDYKENLKEGEDNVK
jgi:hypothetical protein